MAQAPIPEKDIFQYFLDRKKFLLDLPEYEELDPKQLFLEVMKHPKPSRLLQLELWKVKSNAKKVFHALTAICNSVIYTTLLQDPECPVRTQLQFFKSASQTVLLDIWKKDTIDDRSICLISLSSKLLSGSNC